MITSNTNRLIKLASSLQLKKGRLQHKLFLAEGIHLVAEALKAEAEIRCFFWSQRLCATGEGRELLQLLTTRAEGFEVSETVLGKICETETPQGIVAMLSLPQEPVFDLTGTKLGLIIDGLQDPGNVGTIIRTAWAGGLDCLLFTSGTVDPFQGKVVRATMGGIFYQKIYRNLTPRMIAAAAQKAGVQIIAGTPNAVCSCFAVDLTLPTLLLVGNEGKGVTPEWENYAIRRVSIPQPGKAESLNVSVSAGILVYEALRQRLAVNTAKGEASTL
ncbi:MAG TPA: RNA methyltransferase [Bacillota bacterium]